MLQLPTFPTDNLYKFLAIAGLSLVVLSVTYPLSKIVEFEVAIVNIQADREKLKLAISEVERELTALEQKKEPTPEEAKLVRQKYEQIKLQTVELERSTAVSALQAEWIARYSRMSYVGFALGIILANVGFILWYVRVQRPSDRVLANNSNRAA